MGVVREMEFLRPLTVGILSERRSFAPPGCKGGEPAARGLNFLIRAGSKSDGDQPAQKERVITLGGKNLCHVNPGDRILILTPGGGGFGVPE
jgi:5-oxoprolinase (ATP-hydrolysing)